MCIYVKCLDTALHRNAPPFIKIESETQHTDKYISISE